MLSKMFAVVLVIFGIGAAVWSIQTQLTINRTVAKMPTKTIVFETNNPMDAESVESTVYLTREGLSQFASVAARTFVVGHMDRRTGRLSSIWAFAEVPGATTPYGSEISEPPKGKHGWYDYRLKSYRTAVGMVAMNWEPFTRKHNLFMGLLFTFLAWMLALAMVIDTSKAEPSA